MHSDEYVDARVAFQQPDTADPAFGLAYWREAFTHSRFDWWIEDPKVKAQLEGRRNRPWPSFTASRNRAQLPRSYPPTPALLNIT